MNRFVSTYIVFFCALLVSASVVSAQATTTASTSSPEPAIETPVPTRPVFTTEPTLSKIAQTRLTNLAANMSNRMDSAVARLQNVTDRLSSRLSKMEIEGKDVTAARTELALAQNKLNEAKGYLTKIDLEVNAFVGSANPRENWRNVKTTYLGTQTVIIAAHQSILATINLAQNTITVPESITATSTASTTNN